MVGMLSECCLSHGAMQSWYRVHRVTREEFQRQVEERRKHEARESDGRFDADMIDKTAASLRAAERSTGRRVLQAAAAMSVETDTELSLAKVL